MTVSATIERIGSGLAHRGLLSFRTSVFATLTIVLVDTITDRLVPPLVLAGVLDEAGHVATAIVMAAAITRGRTGAFIVAVLLAAWAIDIDHVPGEILGWDGLTAGAPRPYTHSLIILLIAGAWALWEQRPHRDVAAGLTFGLLSHFVRDAASGTGLALFWPLTKRPVEIPYPIYVGILAACLLRTWLVTSRPRDGALAS